MARYRPGGLVWLATRRLVHQVGITGLLVARERPDAGKKWPYPEAAAKPALDGE
jgi:hypothetical protein